MVIDGQEYKNKYKKLLDFLYTYNELLTGQQAIVLETLIDELDKEFPEIADKYLD